MRVGKKNVKCLNCYAFLTEEEKKIALKVGEPICKTCAIALIKSAIRWLEPLLHLIEER